MLFELSHPLSRTEAAALSRSVRAVDDQARIDVDPTGTRLRLDGALTRPQALAALRFSGCRVLPDVEAGHVAGGSTCCGGCS